jgi:hypothetical protein
MGPWHFECRPTAACLSEGAALIRGRAISIQFGLKAAIIWTSHRWREILIFPHFRNEFRSRVLEVSKILRGQKIVWAPDSQMHSYDGFLCETGSIEALIECLISEGFRQLPTFNSIDDEIVASARAGQVSAFITEELG